MSSLKACSCFSSEAFTEFDLLYDDYCNFYYFCKLFVTLKISFCFYYYLDSLEISSNGLLVVLLCILGGGGNRGEFPLGEGFISMLLVRLNDGSFTLDFYCIELFISDLLSIKD
jgi:hypothetical protein